ncbi:protein pelpk2 [Quercus suber]|uniref:Protein pelpk2 n=1 Tax=Quercus suber TaxID=58331 RepID=A0AAW0LDL2_QUESU
MAFSKYCFLLSMIIALSLSSIDVSLATRQLLYTPAAPPPALTLPTVPSLPKVTLPPLPSVPTLPKATLPPLPSTPLPTLPTQPTLPKPTLPPLPSIQVSEELLEMTSYYHIYTFRTLKNLYQEKG